MPEIRTPKHLFPISPLHPPLSPPHFAVVSSCCADKKQHLTVLPCNTGAIVMLPENDSLHLLGFLSYRSEEAGDFVR